MLKLSASVTNLPVVSLRAGTKIATATEMIINPNNLKIEGWHVADRFNKKNLIMVSSEVRDIAPQGIVVNDHEVLSPAEDLVRLKPILEIGFELIGKTVTTESGKRVGKVSDFAIETEALIVKKIYVARSLLKDFSGGNVSIDRTQIVEITDKRIIVEEPTEESKAPAAATVATN
jgi:sporulation protein YlmC with PRC-barrel domain